MEYFKILKFVLDNFPDFNPENKRDLIRAEKILIVERKLNSEINLNDIEFFLNNAKKQENEFVNILKHPFIKSIYEGKDLFIPKTRQHFDGVTLEEIRAFSVFISPYLEKTVLKLISENRWASIQNLLGSFPQIFSFKTIDFLKNEIHKKNNLLIENLGNYEDLSKFAIDFPHCRSISFFKIQSKIDHYFFEDQMIEIYNLLIKKKHLKLRYKIILGDIINAVCSYQSSDSNFSHSLIAFSKNGTIWSNKKNGLYNKFLIHISDFFTKNEEFGISFWISILMIFIFIFSFVYVFSKGWLLFFFYCFIVLITFLLTSASAYFGFNSYDNDSSKNKIRRLGGNLFLTLINAFPIFLVVEFTTYLYFSSDINNIPTFLPITILMISRLLISNKN